MLILILKLFIWSLYFILSYQLFQKEISFKANPDTKRLYKADNFQESSWLREKTQVKKV